LGNGIAEVESNLELSELAERFGTVPLPPYLHREATNDDKKRYQTVWAKNMGSAAAPTASLNMTDELLEKLKQKGVIIKYLTLHVGLGTFLPMRTDKVEDHKMHSEWFHIPEDTINAINNADGRIIALGTTVARTLEYYARTGKTEGEDDIFIYPGFEFKLVDALITNFHAPKSTVLMLASAFAGWDHLKSAYNHAVKEKYNFLSYGDSMFIC
jgi:S-adenosylmethionine:tRNA ribosyltransferase-isomerase